MPESVLMPTANPMPTHNPCQSPFNNANSIANPVWSNLANTCLVMLVERMSYLKVGVVVVVGGEQSQGNRTHLG